MLGTGIQVLTIIIIKILLIIVRHRTHLQAIPLAMITIRKPPHGFLPVHISMVLGLTALQVAGALL